MKLTLTELDEQEILRYLGCRGEPDEGTLRLVHRGREELLETAVPRFVQRVCSFAEEAEGIRLDSGLLLPGEDIKRHVKRCKQVVVMACTIAAQVDALIRRWEAEDMAYALVLDACGTAAVEMVCSLTERELCPMFPGHFFTWRFSPGYGDLPITLQNDILTLIDAPRKIGLCATGHHILTPRKSVTALLGIAQEELEQDRQGCQSCRLGDHCTFRKAGAHCGAS